MALANPNIGVLPYASELFGVYQPLMGWRSQQMSDRWQQQQATTYLALFDRLEAISSRSWGPDGPSPLGGVTPRIPSALDAAITRALLRSIGFERPDDWADAAGADRLRELSREITEALSNRGALADLRWLASYVENLEPDPRASPAALSGFLAHEERVAYYLGFLARTAPHALSTLLFSESNARAMQSALLSDPLVTFGRSDLDAVLSPIGIVNLFREYFFELGSFLGPSVGHIWLSPGSSAELIEVNTRRQLTEREIQTSTETTTKTEDEATQKDELSDAIKEDNSSNLKFGVTNTFAYRTPVIQDTATASFSLDTKKSSARETTHKQMREQSEKLSSEIKKSFKSTFRVTTEYTDTSSRRYLLANTTNRLVNYELRRKMRTVGVQVQDVGTQLCWNVFVDDPGADLGHGQLVHIGQPPDLAGLVPPDAPVGLGPKVQEVSFPLGFSGTDTDDNDMGYRNGGEADVGAVDIKEHIVADFPRTAMFERPGFGYVDGSLRVEAAEGSDVDPRVAGDVSFDPDTGLVSFVIHLDYVHFHGRDQVTVKARLTWMPSEDMQKTAKATYDANMKQYTSERDRIYRDAFIAASRERIELASRVPKRSADVLREEERTVIYRRLISQLMKVGPATSKHVSSELIRTIFDVDKMLYFVAPEWWTPRLHRSTQALPKTATPPPTRASTAAKPATPAHANAPVDYTKLTVDVNSPVRRTIERDALRLDPARPARAGIPGEAIVDWGGDRERERDSYYITEKSEPAPLGASLGWLLQLDGDDLRNALLNSPWVKAVIPIRPGMEDAAVNWLRQAGVEGEEGLDEEYVASPDDPPELVSTPQKKVTVSDAVAYLIGQIRAYNENLSSVITGNPADPADPRNHFLGSLPSEAVFEHGYYPLAGGVNFADSGTQQAMVSQWTEILPTEQVAAVEVEYDPISLKVKGVAQPAPGAGGASPPG